MVNQVHNAKETENKRHSAMADVPLPRAISIAKYKNLLNAAQKLFFQFGLHKVSIDEICAKAKVSKMTFYKEFANKNQLALVVYESYNARAVKDTQKLLEQSIDFLEMIERLILLKQKFSKILGSVFIKDIMSETEFFSQLMESAVKEQKELRLQILQRGKDEGYIRPEIDGDLFELLIQNFAGLFANQDFLQKYPDAENLSRMGVELFFYGLSNRREKTSFVSPKQKSAKAVPRKSKQASLNNQKNNQKKVLKKSSTPTPTPRRKK